MIWPHGCAMAKRAWRLALVGILVGALVFIGGEDLHVPVPMSLVAYVGTVLVFIASYDRNYIMAPGWTRNIFLWVGMRSYAIYLIHIPAYFATREIWFRLQPPGIGFDPNFTGKFLVTAVVLMVVFAELNYRLVEVPLRRRGAEIATRFRATHLQPAA